MEKTFDTHSVAITSFYTIDRIVEEWWKRWWDAILLYFKYQEKSNIDATNQPRATDTYMMKWLWRWKDRFYWAKNILTKLWLIESVQEKINWKFWKTYIRVKFRMKTDWIDTALLETRTPENQVSWKQETNAYSTKVNAYSTIINDISKDISADAKKPTQHIQESKLDNTDTEQTNTHNTPTSLETNEVERNADLTITAEDIFNAYKWNTQRKWTLDDLKKVVRGKSYEELKAILLEMRLFTFEYRLKLTSSETKNWKKIDYSNSCAHLAEKPDTDEESIISRVESIVNAFKTHKNKNEKIRNEWKREIEEYFKDYIWYIGNTANMTKEERRAEFDKYASVWQMAKFKELYPTADIRAIKEDWLLRCAQWRR